MHDNATHPNCHNPNYCSNLKTTPTMATMNSITIFRLFRGKLHTTCIHTINICYTIKSKLLLLLLLVSLITLFLKPREITIFISAPIRHSEFFSKQSSKPSTCGRVKSLRTSISITHSRISLTRLRRRKSEARRSWKRRSTPSTISENQQVFCFPVLESDKTKASTSWARPRVDAGRERPSQRRSSSSSSMKWGSNRSGLSIDLKWSTRSLPLLNNRYCRPRLSPASSTSIAYRRPPDVDDHVRGAWPSPTPASRKSPRLSFKLPHAVVACQAVGCSRRRLMGSLDVEP